MIVKDKLHHVISKSKKETILSYQGPVNIDILVGIGENIKNLTKDYPNAKRKIHKIFIELAQNITSYSAANIKMDGNDIGVGILILEEQTKYYIFTFGNLVKQKDGEILIQRCDIINSLDREGLRQLKRTKRLNSEKIKLNAHIGLIHAALLSENLLDFEAESLNDEHSFFTIKIKIEKS